MRNWRWTTGAALAAILALVAGILPTGIASAQICRKHKLGADYSWFHNTAKAEVGELTSDPSRAHLYVARAPSGEIYVHSNFVTEGFENPTKIATPGSPELMTLAAYVLEAEPNLSDGTRLAEVARLPIKYTFDETMFTAAGELTIDVPEATNNFWVKRGREAKPDRLVALPDSDYRKRWVTTPERSLFVNAAIDADGLRRRLSEVDFRRDRFAVVSFVEDESTKAALGKLQIGASNLTRGLGKQSLDKQLARNRDGIVALVGHIEEGEYVARGADGAELGRVSLSDAEQLATKHNVTIVQLGCSSREHAPVGLHGDVNSLAVVERLAAASSAADYWSFLSKLASDDTPLVIGEALVVKTSHKKGRAAIRVVIAELGAASPALVVVVFPSATASGNTEEVEMTSEMASDFPAIEERPVLGVSLPAPGGGLAALLAQLSDVGGNGGFEIAVSEDSPAERGGLQDGDRLLAVDGRSLKKLTRDETEKLLSGKIGTPVRLKVLSGLTGEVKSIRLVRDSRPMLKPEEVD